ncbi:hypothetical protein SUGI_0700310 [Cryptomeria japonica]|nr:hypothetical protein SUGI_0700310 [Cryptomeria japonica]
MDGYGGYICPAPELRKYMVIKQKAQRRMNCPVDNKSSEVWKWTALQGESKEISADEKRASRKSNGVVFAPEFDGLHCYANLISR